jgi:lactoylglutathione lyase
MSEVGRAYRIRHLALEVADLEKSIQFYQNVFGMKVLRTRRNPIRNDLAAYLGYHDEQVDVSIELYQFLHQSPALDGNRGFHFALAVENIEAVHERAVKAGALSKTAPQNNRPNSINKFAFILDPDGHEIELTENAHGAQS